MSTPKPAAVSNQAAAEIIEEIVREMRRYYNADSEFILEWAERLDRVRQAIAKADGRRIRSTMRHVHADCPFCICEPTR